jgi:hypothetical protein
MRTPVRLVLRFSACLAAAAFLALLLSPSSPLSSPYASALSDLTSGAPALAAGHCADKTCGSVGGPCVQAAGYFCAKSGGQCFTRACQ